MQHWPINRRNLIVMLVTGVFLVTLVWWHKKNSQQSVNLHPGKREEMKGNKQTDPSLDEVSSSDIQLKLSDVPSGSLETLDKETRAKLYFNQAREHVIAGKLTDALTLLDLSLKNNPNDANAYTTRGVVTAELGDPQKGLADLEKAAQIAPENYAVLHNYAKWLDSEGFYKKAEVVYKRALELQPTSTESLEGLCSLYVGAGELEKGLATCTTALAKAEKTSAPLLNRAIINFEMKRFGEASKDVEAYREIVRQDPESYSKGLTLSARIYLALGNNKKASEMYDELIRLNGVDKELILIVIRDYFEKGEKKEAPDLLGRYIKTNALPLPEKALMYRTQSAFYARAGYLDEAIFAGGEAVKTLALTADYGEKYQEAVNEVEKLKSEKASKKSK